MDKNNQKTIIVFMKNHQIFSYFLIVFVKLTQFVIVS
jgi:hypothetical protein